MWCFPAVDSFVTFIIIFHHFLSAYAQRTTCGEAVEEGSIQCIKLSFGMELKSYCSGDVYINGKVSNGSVFRVTSVADYGTYRCYSKKFDGTVTYFVLPGNCTGERNPS